MKIDLVNRKNGALFRIRFWAQIAIYRFFVAPFKIHHWRDYDPSWLVELAEKQVPHLHWLPDALKQCVHASGFPPYIHFVSSRKPNKSNSEWQFEQNITLEHPEYGELILDILKDHRVGGVEFLGLLLRGN